MNGKDKAALPPGAVPLTRGSRIALAAGLAVAALACAAGLWYVKVVDVSGGALLPPCLLHAFTGLYCAGCGITRALHLIMNGHIWAGFRMNPLAVLGLPFLAWFTALIFIRMIRGRPLPLLPLWLPWVILGAIVLYMVARNLPWEPFSWLAPTVVQ